MADIDKQRFVGIIPSRFASSRFPGKPLALIGGKSMVERVYTQVSKVLDLVYVATDDERIFKAVEAFGGKAVMTSEKHKSGTDRVQEAYSKIGQGREIVINIQGDEPFIQASQLQTLCQCFNMPQTQIATLVKPFVAADGVEALFNPNSPKVVLGADGQALYFSRSVVPFLRGAEKEDWLNLHTFYKHIGLYAYRADVLKQITALPQGALEKVESLEQLRWLENGFRIQTGVTMAETVGIDTPEDLNRAEFFLAANSHLF